MLMYTLKINPPKITFGHNQWSVYDFTFPWADFTHRTIPYPTTKYQTVSKEINTSNLIELRPFLNQFWFHDILESHTLWKR